MRIPEDVRGELIRIVAAGLVGAVVFVAAQMLKGFPQHIAEFIGSQVVQRGGYPEGLAAPVGWGVHLGVALAYAALFGLLARIPALRRGPRSWLPALLLVPVLGYLTTLIAGPAVAITIALLAGQGVPAALPPLNRGLDFVFWNHLLFFVVCYLVIVLIPRARMRAAAGTQSAVGSGDRGV